MGMGPGEGGWARLFVTCWVCGSWRPSGGNVKGAVKLPFKSQERKPSCRPRCGGRRFKLKLRS